MPQRGKWRGLILWRTIKIKNVLTNFALAPRLKEASIAVRIAKRQKIQPTWHAVAAIPVARAPSKLPRAPFATPQLSELLPVLTKKPCSRSADSSSELNDSGYLP